MSEIQILVAEYSIHNTMGCITPLHFITLDTLPSILHSYQEKLDKCNPRFSNMTYRIWLYICIANIPISVLSDIQLIVKKDKIIHDYTEETLTIDNIINILKNQYRKIIIDM